MSSEYTSHRNGDVVKIEIRDQTYKVLYRKKFNGNDMNAWWEVIQVSEKFGFSVVELIKQKLGIGDFF